MEPWNSLGDIFTCYQSQWECPLALLIRPEWGILTGLFGVKVSEPLRMSNQNIVVVSTDDAPHTPHTNHYTQTIKMILKVFIVWVLNILQCTVWKILIFPLRYNLASYRTFYFDQALNKGSCLKFDQNRASNCWDIADMDKCPQDKCCLNKCRGDSFNLLYMFPGPFV